jgi:uncharacterized membrane protein YdjX (TVP38/TMEM64 family)
LFSTRCEEGFSQEDQCGMTSDMASPARFTTAKRWLPLALVVCLMAVAYAVGVHEHLSLHSIATNREELRQFIANNWGLALLIYVLIYACAVALSIPGATLLTIAGGLMFGWLTGAVAAMIAATAGATLIFLAARTSLEEALTRKAGSLVNKIQDGFKRDAFNYLLFLRLTPVFPFWLVNIAAALAQVRLKTFVAATILGIIPATLAFSFVGSGLDSLIDSQKLAYDACLAQNGATPCSFDLSLSRMITPQILLALAALGVAALIPVLAKRWQGKP